MQASGEEMEKKYTELEKKYTNSLDAQAKVEEDLEAKGKELASFKKKLEGHHAVGGQIVQTPV